jgi:cell volume regulation protein A
MLDLTSTFIVAAIILLIGFLADLLFRRTSFPDILFLLIVGIVLGPVLGIVSRNDLTPVMPYLIELSLMMILFYGGMEMDISKVLAQSGRAFLLASTYFVFVTATVTVVAKFVFNIDWIPALMFGPMIAGTSSIVIIPLSKRLNLQEETSLTLSLESTITDVLNIVFFFAVLELYLSGNISLISAARDIAAEFGVGILMGFTVGVIWLIILYRIRKEPYTYISTLAILILTFMGSELLGGSGVLSALTMGLIIGNHARMSSFLKMHIDSPKFEEVRSFLSRFQSELTFLVRSFFFVLLGLIYDASFRTLTFGLLVGLVFAGLDLGLRYLAVRLTVLRSSMRKNATTMTLLCGQGLAHATLSVIPQQYGVPNAEIYPMIVVTLIIITNIITSLGAFLIARRTKDTQTQVNTHRS